MKPHVHAVVVVLAGLGCTPSGGGEDAGAEGGIPSSSSAAPHSSSQARSSSSRSRSSSAAGSTSEDSSSAPASSSAEASSSSSAEPPVCVNAPANTCQQPSDCPPALACLRATCGRDHCCGLGNAPAGTLAPEDFQTSGDCQVVGCDHFGTPQPQPDDQDVPPDANDCQVGSCAEGNPIQTPRPEGTACTSDGGQVCSADGRCVPAP